MEEVLFLNFCVLIWKSCKRWTFPNPKYWSNPYHQLADVTWSRKIFQGSVRAYWVKLKLKIQYQYNLAQECEDPSYVAVLASHTAHRAANKAIASNAIAINDFENAEMKEEDANDKSKNASRAFSLCEQASEFLEASVRWVSIFLGSWSSVWIVCLKS